jgi:uncharacterized Ntn-hydrolase superfamily protein
MILRVLLVITVAACQREATRPPAPAPRADSCRAHGAVDEVPLGTMTGSPLRPAHTFSIVARDPRTGELGVAVQSHWFSVGSLVTWAEPGVGAIATQSFVEPGYGPKGLALMASGLSAPDALARLVAEDPQAAVRQLGFVDAQGRVASHTGARCIQVASDRAGSGYAVQANIMANDRVVPAMAAAFEAARGDLADRMLAALDAAQATGGDLRGCQSAAILVVSGKRSDTPWRERELDLRVEDSPAPLDELRRLVTLARAYDRMNQGDAAVEKSDMTAALDHYSAAARMAPDNIEMRYWQAVTLAGHGRFDDAMPLFRAAFAVDPGWAELTRRLVAPGFLPDRATADRVLREAR